MSADEDHEVRSTITVYSTAPHVGKLTFHSTALCRQGRFTFLHWLVEGIDKFIDQLLYRKNRAVYPPTSMAPFSPNFTSPSPHFPLLTFSSFSPFPLFSSSLPLPSPSSSLPPKFADLSLQKERYISGMTRKCEIILYPDIKYRRLA